MVKRVRVKAHMRDGQLIDEHDREVDGDEKLSLKQRIKKRKQDEAKSKTLFGD